MADPRFFANKGPFSLGRLAERGQARLAAGVDPRRLVRDVAPLDRAGPDDVSFLDNPAYKDVFGSSRAGACVVHPKFAGGAPAGMALLLSEQPYRSYALIAQLFYPRPPLAPGIAASAVVDASARIGEGCEVSHHVYVGPGAEIGPRCYLGPGVAIGPAVVLGEDCILHAGVSVSHALIGARVTLHPGARVGQDGFGFAPDPAGHVKVPQLGRVIIHDDCDIGANTTIDRGSMQDTVIGAGCWIDNQVQIGHNVQMGRGCIVVALAGISGSTQLGDHVALGGQAGVAGHLTIGTGAQIAAQSGVMQDIAPGARVAGSPAMPIREHFRMLTAMRRLVEKKDRADG